MAKEQTVPVDEITEPLVINGRGVDFRGRGVRLRTTEKVPGAVIVKGDRSYIKDCPAIEMIYEGPPLNEEDGPQTDHLGPHALYLDGATDCEIEVDSAISNVGDGLYVGTTENHKDHPRDVRVTEGLFVGGRNGMTVASCEGFFSKDCKFISTNDNPTMYGALFEPGNSTQVMRNIVMCSPEFPTGTLMAFFGVAMSRLDDNDAWDVTINDPIFGDFLHRENNTSTRIWELIGRGAKAKGALVVNFNGEEFFRGTYRVYVP